MPLRRRLLAVVTIVAALASTTAFSLPVAAQTTEPAASEGTWRGWVLFQNLNKGFNTRRTTSDRYGEWTYIERLINDAPQAAWVDTDPNGFDATWFEGVKWQHSGYDPECTIEFKSWRWRDYDTWEQESGMQFRGPATWALGPADPQKIGQPRDDYFGDTAGWKGLQLTSAPLAEFPITYAQTCGATHPDEMMTHPTVLLDVAAAAKPRSSSSGPYMYESYYNVLFNGTWGNYYNGDEYSGTWGGRVTVCMTQSEVDTDGDGLPNVVDQDPKVSGSPHRLGVPESYGAYGGKFGVNAYCPLERYGGAGGTSAGELAPTGIGDLGMTCGVTQFPWFTIAHTETFVKRDEQVCTVLLSNAVAQEALRLAYDENKTLTEIFGGQMRQLVASDLTEEEAQNLLIEAGWEEWGARGVAATSRFIKAGNFFSSALELSKEFAIALHATWVINTILHKGACVQLNMDADGETLKVNWHLVYNPAYLKNPDGDRELTIASIW
ncbi:MAG: hypothetical protein LC808_27030 [Actinobacteria bacterium]|nr:hypothetical protein [Actinomycetota bacterium]